MGDVAELPTRRCVSNGLVAYITPLHSAACAPKTCIFVLMVEKVIHPGATVSFAQMCRFRRAGNNVAMKIACFLLTQNAYLVLITRIMKMNL